MVIWPTLEHWKRDIGRLAASTIGLLLFRPVHFCFVALWEQNAQSNHRLPRRMTRTFLTEPFRNVSPLSKYLCVEVSIRRNRWNITRLWSIDRLVDVDFRQPSTDEFLQLIWPRQMQLQSCKFLGWRTKVSHNERIVSSWLLDNLYCFLASSGWLFMVSTLLCPKKLHLEQI